MPEAILALALATIKPGYTQVVLALARNLFDLFHHGTGSHRSLELRTTKSVSIHNLIRPSWTFVRLNPVGILALRKSST